jgi:uncharacterized membrane protein YgcG
VSSQTWIEFAGFIGAIVLVMWLSGAIPFWMDASTTRKRVSPRAREMESVLRALTVLLGLYDEGPSREACHRRTLALQQRFAEGRRQEARARWLVWVQPSRAARLLYEAWAWLPHGEQELSALVTETETRIWRQSALRVSATPASGAHDPLRAQVEAVRELSSHLEEAWPTLSTGPARQVIALTAPEKWLLASDRVDPEAGDRQATMATLADRAWACVALFEAARPEGHALRARFDRMKRAQQRAERPRARVQAAPPEPFQLEYDALQAAMQEGDRLFEQAREMRALLGSHRATFLFEEATQRYERRTWVRAGELAEPRRPQPARPRYRASGEGGQERGELPELDSFGDWPESSGLDGSNVDPGFSTESGPSYESAPGGEWSDGGSSYDGGSGVSSGGDSSGWIGGGGD